MDLGASLPHRGTFSFTCSGEVSRRGFCLFRDRVLLAEAFLCFPQEVLVRGVRVMVNRRFTLAFPGSVEPSEVSRLGVHSEVENPVCHFNQPRLLTKWDRKQDKLC
jgi:hypothetical protein